MPLQLTNYNHHPFYYYLNPPFTTYLNFSYSFIYSIEVPFSNVGYFKSSTPISRNSPVLFCLVCFFAVLFALFTARVFRQADHTHCTPHPAPRTPLSAHSAHSTFRTQVSSNGAEFRFSWRHCRLTSHTHTRSIMCLATHTHTDAGPRTGTVGIIGVTSALRSAGAQNNQRQRRFCRWRCW